MSSARGLTTTSYAILGLLAVRPWSTYELTRQMDRSLGRFGPRAESKLYEEPKKLAAQGLAVAAPEQVGRRPRTVWSITDEGQRAPNSAQTVFPVPWSSTHQRSDRAATIARPRPSVSSSAAARVQGRRSLS